MIKGSTPTLVFTLNNISDFSLIDNILVTIAPADEKRNTSITKTKEMITLDPSDKTVKVQLTQEETLRFPRVIEVQMKVLLTDGIVMISKIFTIEVDRVLKKEVIAGAGS